jgi:hypothetical protein
MACNKQNGVKNILLTFTDCDTEEVIGPISHEQPDDTLPTFKNCAWTNTALTNGYVQRSASNATMTLPVVRDLRVPLAYYQGCAQVDVQVEKFDGTVYTLTEGAVTEPEESDGRSVTMTIIAAEIDELLPPGSLAAA